MILVVMVSAHLSFMKCFFWLKKKKPTQHTLCGRHRFGTQGFISDSRTKRLYHQECTTNTQGGARVSLPVRDSVFHIDDFGYHGECSQNDLFLLQLLIMSHKILSSLQTIILIKNLCHNMILDAWRSSASGVGVYIG